MTAVSLGSCQQSVFTTYLHLIVNIWTPKMASEPNGMNGNEVDPTYHQMCMGLGEFNQPCMKPTPDAGSGSIINVKVNKAGCKPFSEQSSLLELNGSVTKGQNITVQKHEQSKPASSEETGSFLDGEDFSVLSRQQLQNLQTVLTHMKLPNTLDRRSTPRSGDGPRITVVLVAELKEVLNIFLEGNCQCPDGFLYIPTVSWLLRCPIKSKDDNIEGPTDSLFVRMAVTADASGQTYLDIFKPPRKVTYLDNLLYATVTLSGVGEGEELGRFGLDTPASGSLELNARVDDKLLTTSMCAAVGVPHPYTLGLWLPGGKNFKTYEYPECYPSISVLQLEPDDSQQDWECVEKKVREFVTSSQLEKYERVVTKPYGPDWNTCKGVSYHTRMDIPSIMAAIQNLKSRIAPGSGILVQSYHTTFDPLVKPEHMIGRHSIDVEGIPLGFRVRAIVVRTPDNNCRMSQVVCAVSDGNKPIGGFSCVPTSLSLTLRRWGVTDETGQRIIYRIIQDNCERLMGELIRQEALLTDRQRGGHGSRTELVGIDLILTQEEEDGQLSHLRPVVIEVNAQDCLYHCTVMELMQSHLRGRAVTPMVHTILQRSLLYLMAGSTVLAIGIGGYSKRHLWKDAAGAIGVKLVLVDNDAEHPARSVVDTFLHVDITDHTRDQEHAQTIIHMLQKALPDHQIAGCLTWMEDCVPLAAYVAQALNLPHIPNPEAALAAKSKAQTHAKLFPIKQPPHDLPPKVYASCVAKVDSLEQVAEAAEKIPMPAVIKLEYGSGAVGVKIVDTIKEAQDYLALVQSTLCSEEDHPGIGLGHGQSMILMPRLMGTEHDVDIVIFEDQVVAAFISDNGPTRVPGCGDTAALMPSVLPKEERQQLIAAAASCCRGVGLHTGVFNVEIMNTPRGPRLIEINACMGGFYQRDWVWRIYNVDLFHLSLMCACGIRPVLTGNSSLDDDEAPPRHNCPCTKDPLAGMKKEGQVCYLEEDLAVDYSTAPASRAAKEYDTGYINKKLRANQDTWSHGCNKAEKKRHGPKFSDKSYIMGIQLYPSRHGLALKTTANQDKLKRLHDEGRIIFYQFEPEVDQGNNDFEEPYGNLAVQAPCMHEARTKLVSICVSLGLETEESIANVLSDFVDLSP